MCQGSQVSDSDSDISPAEVTTIPTHLFRVHTPDSAGFTSTAAVVSPALLHWCQTKIASKEPANVPLPDRLCDLLHEEAARRLVRHLRRGCLGEEESCNLMSWPSSLLFVLQYAVYLHAEGFSRPELSEIYLLVLDTTKLPLRVRGDFMHDIDLIKKYQPFSGDLRSFSQLRMVNNCGY